MSAKAMGMLNSISADELNWAYMVLINDSISGPLVVPMQSRWLSHARVDRFTAERQPKNLSNLKVSNLKNVIILN